MSDLQTLIEVWNTAAYLDMITNYIIYSNSPEYQSLCSIRRAAVKYVSALADTISPTAFVINDAQQRGAL
jgi:hypothetical protein